MKLIHAIPALPVTDISQRLPFYRDILGFSLGYHDSEFAILQRDGVELHLWAATDESWRTRTDQMPVVYGSESFIAGTASCRIAMTGVDELYAALQPRDVIHPNAHIANRPWGTREFGVIDPDNNLITFFERL